tara:strand:- start:744 stop:917 length:174 start_codon:yes stop_codon:yes gene_type:complete
MLHKIEKDLPEAAKRSLSEAKERHALTKKNELPKELGGRNGPEPTTLWRLGEKRNCF